MKKYRLNSYEGETICPNHLKIDNTNLSPEEVTDIIVKHFELPTIDQVPSRRI